MNEGVDSKVFYRYISMSLRLSHLLPRCKTNQISSFSLVQSGQAAVKGERLKPEILLDLAIIAAGEGSRLKAEGVLTPKALVPIGGVPLVERIIRSAVRHGAGSVRCIVNEESPALKEFLLESNFGASIDVTIRSTPSSLHSLAALAPKLQNAPFLLTTVDSIFKDEEFHQFLNYATTQERNDGTLAVTEFIDDEKPLFVEMDSEQRILRFMDERRGTQWITGGLYYFEPAVLGEIAEAIRSGTSRLRNFLRLLAVKGYKLQGFPFSKIIDVDHLHDIQAAEEFLSQYPSSFSVS